MVGHESDVALCVVYWSALVTFLQSPALDCNRIDSMYPPWLPTQGLPPPQDPSRDTMDKTMALGVHESSSCFAFEV